MLDQPVPNPLAKNPNFYTHKVFAAIGIILIVTIAIVAGVWYYVESQGGNKTPETQNDVKVSTQTAKTATKSAEKDETADWKTFTSTKWGFKVKYPKDWAIANDTETGATLVSVAELGGDTPQIRIGFSFAEIAGITTSYNAVTSYEINKPTKVKPEYQVADEIDTYIRLEDTTIDSYKAVRTKLDLGYKDLDSSDTYIVFIVKGNRIYQVGISGGINIDEKVKLLDRILSTFKFLD